MENIVLQIKISTWTAIVIWAQPTLLQWIVKQKDFNTYYRTRLEQHVKKLDHLRLFHFIKESRAATLEYCHFFV